MINKPSIFILTIIISLCQWSMHAQDDWELVKDSDDIKVYTKRVATSDFKAFKAEMIINQDIHAFLSVLHDIGDLDVWAYKLKYTELLERKGDSMQIYYAVAKAPFPYKNRDGVYLNSFKWDSKSKTLTVDIKLLEDYLAEKDGLVRINGVGFWKATVLPSNKLKIDFQMQVDLGGDIPAWLANIFADDSPYYTLLELREAIKNKKYATKTYSFID